MSNDEARRAREKEKLDAYIKRVVAEAPPLTKEQRDRLAILLRPERATEHEGEHDAARADG